MKFTYRLSAALVGTAATIALVQHQLVLAKTATEIRSIAEAITVRIDGPGSERNNGSGVIIERQNNNYTIITAAHVVDAPGRYTISTSDGRRYTINSSQVRRLPGVDLATLQFTSNRNYSVARKGNSDQMRGGMTIYAAGWYNPGPVVTERIFDTASGRIVSHFQPKNGYALAYRLDVAQPGMSGGPVLDSEGRLIAINGRAERDLRTGNVNLVTGIPINTFERLQAAVSRRSVPQNSSPSSVSRRSAPQNSSPFSSGNKELVDEVWQIVNRNYIDSTFNQVDWRAVRTEYLTLNYTTREQAYQAIREMLDLLQDSFTRFMDPEEFKDMQINPDGKNTGVGIQLSQDEETKKLVVVYASLDTPAFRAGIFAGDVIVKIDGQNTEGMDAHDAKKLLRGLIGTSVTLTILRGKEEIDFDLRRERVEIDPVSYSYKPEANDRGIGYIRLKQFSHPAAREMRDAIEDLEAKNVSGYILDMRYNPGGLLDTSIEIARMWLKNGTIFSTINRRGKIEQRRANNLALTDKPLVVIVDEGSASGSEILAAALQDNRRARIVGTQTRGFSSIQSVRTLSDGSGLAVTVAKFLTPNGRDINKLGIKPDVAIGLTNKQKRRLRRNLTLIGTKADPQYAKALEVLNQEIARGR